MKAPGTKLASLLVALLLAACSTVDVTTDYDRSAAFGSYKTYSLAPGPDGRKLPSYAETTLRNVIRTRLAARGVSESTDSKADLAIVWHVFLEEDASVPPYAEGYGSDWPYAYGVYGLWIGAPPSYSNTSPYPEGTLILDVVDMRTQKLVFRGMGSAVVIDPERSARNIEKAVTKMVEALPAVR